MVQRLSRAGLVLLAAAGACTTSSDDPALDLYVRFDAIEGDTAPSATVPYRAFRLRDCLCTPEGWATAVQDTGDPFSASDPFDADEGPWCWAEVTFTGPIQISTDVTFSGEFTFALDVGQLWVSADAATAGTSDLPDDTCDDENRPTGWGDVATGESTPTPIILELGPQDMLDEVIATITRTGESRTVDSSHAEHDGLVAMIQTASALYIDTDEDGELSDEERAAGPVATGSARTDELD